MKTVQTYNMLTSTSFNIYFMARDSFFAYAINFFLLIPNNYFKKLIAGIFSCRILF